MGDNIGVNRAPIAQFCVLFALLLGVFWVALPKTHPQTTYLAYVERIDDAFQVFLVSVDCMSGSAPTPPKQITNIYYSYEHDFTWSPDGQYLAFVAISDNYSGGRLVVIKINWTGQTSFAFGASGTNPVWSLDSQWLAYTAADGLWNSELHIVHLTDSHDYQITDAIGHNFGLFEKTAWITPRAWSPNDHYLVFQDGVFGSYAARQTAEIYIADVTHPSTPRLTRLTQNDVADYAPGWSVDGNSILFMSGRGGKDEAYAMNPDGSHVQKSLSSFTQESSNKNSNGEFYAFSVAGSGFQILPGPHPDLSRLTSQVDTSNVAFQPGCSAIH